MKYGKDHKVEKQIGIYPRKCRWCGKEFECRREYGWKIPISRKSDFYYYFCKYSCMRAYEKDKEEKKVRGKKTPEDKQVLALLNAGYNQCEASRITGVNYRRVRTIRDKWGTI